MLPGFPRKPGNMHEPYGRLVNLTAYLTANGVYGGYIPTLGRYCIASATWFANIISLSAKSAIGLANFNTR